MASTTPVRSAWITTTRTSKRGGTYRHWRRVRVTSKLRDAFELGIGDASALANRSRPLDLTTR